MDLHFRKIALNTIRTKDFRRAIMEARRQTEGNRSHPVSVGLGEDRNKNGEKVELTRIAHDDKTRPSRPCSITSDQQFPHTSLLCCCARAVLVFPCRKLPLIG